MTGRHYNSELLTSIEGVNFGDLTQTVKLLLTSPELHTLPPQERGRYVVDWWIGALVNLHGLGRLQGSLGDDAGTPHGMLERIDRQIERGWDENHARVTSSAGLRDSVDALLKRKDTRGFLDGTYGTTLSSRLRRDGPGRTVLSNMAQVAGYVFAARPSVESWQSPLVDAIGYAVKREGMRGLSADERYYQAMGAVAEAGVRFIDSDLIRNSVDHMHAAVAHPSTAAAVGRVALPFSP